MFLGHSEVLYHPRAATINESLLTQERGLLCRITLSLLYVPCYHRISVFSIYCYNVHTVSVPPVYNSSTYVLSITTVEPPNKGQVGAWALVHYSGVVLYWGVFIKKPFLCVVSIELYILLVYKLLWSVLEQQ